MSIPFCRAAALARGVGLEGAALTGHLLLYPGGFTPERHPTPGRLHCAHPSDSGHSPVLLVHGLFDNRAVFTVLRHNLHVHGWDHVHALNYSPFSLDVPRAATLLGRHVERLRRVYGGEPVTIIGHSLGGLIARYYVQRLGGDALVPRVVTLATPHQGTEAARLLQPLPIVRQLRAGSAVLAELEQPARGCRTRFLCFWGDLDPLILPPRNGALRHPDLRAENIVIRNAGHLSLPIHGEVLARIREWLPQSQDPLEGPDMTNSQIA
ncbi:esterase/lipase family protein [Streptacidiphilus neutrinimicus]|uniref:esterase/lipase family protein n=1 Tax=Streptacidiphilus neutrinimicus TaxID=105420 RepID=UPI0005AA640A|nr:alpha/beta fold hydrolase [Streptacidiphilus neutrinimicus]